MPISRTVRPEPPCEPPSRPPSVCALRKWPDSHGQQHRPCSGQRGGNGWGKRRVLQGRSVLRLAPLRRARRRSCGDGWIWRSPPQIWRSPARRHFPVHRQSAQRLDRSESAEVQPLVRAASCCLSAAEPYHSGTLRTTKQRAHLQLQAGNVDFDPITDSDPAAHASDGSGRIGVRSMVRLQPSHPHYPRTSGGTEY